MKRNGIFSKDDLDGHYELQEVRIDRDLRELYDYAHKFYGPDAKVGDLDENDGSLGFLEEPESGDLEERWNTDYISASY